MAKLVKKLSLKQGDTSEEFYFDATTGVKGYDLYSTDEMVVGKWIDGKPIYRKTVPITVTKRSMNYTVEGIDLETPIRAFGLVDSSAEKVTVPLLNLSLSNYNVGIWLNESGMIRIEYGSSRTVPESIIVVIEYTKKSDQPDSFVEEKVELTAEHKTGETFNGKDVYEMFWEGVNPSQNTPLTIPLNNVEKIIDVDAQVFNSVGKQWTKHGYYYSTTNNFNIYFTDTIVYTQYQGSHFSGSPLRVKLKYTKKA